MTITVIESEKYLFDNVVVEVRHEEGVWKLTPHGLTLGSAMLKARHALVGQSVLEIGVGCGIHLILASKLGARLLDGTDIDEHSLTLTRENASRNDVFIHSLSQQDWLEFIPHREYDTLICNPPFCKAGTPDRRHFIEELIRKAPRFLRPGGHLLFVQSSMADFAKTEQELSKAGYYFDIAHEAKHLFRDYYFSEPGFLEESRRVPAGFEKMDGCYVETLRAYWATRLR